MRRKRERERDRQIAYFSLLLPVYQLRQVVRSCGSTQVFACTQASCCHSLALLILYALFGIHFQSLFIRAAVPSIGVAACRAVDIVGNIALSFGEAPDTRHPAAHASLHPMYISVASLLKHLCCVSACGSPWVCTIYDYFGIFIDWVRSHGACDLAIVHKL